MDMHVSQVFVSVRFQVSSFFKKSKRARARSKRTMRAKEPKAQYGHARGRLVSQCALRTRMRIDRQIGEEAGSNMHAHAHTHRQAGTLALHMGTRNSVVCPVAK